MGLRARYRHWKQKRAALRSTEAMDPYYYSIINPAGFSIPMLAFKDTDVERLLTACSWANVAIMKNSAAMAALQPTVQIWKNRRWQVAPDNHTLWQWLDDPLGPDDTLPFWSWARLIETITIHRYLVGNAFLVPQIIQGGKRIYSVLPLLSPQIMKASEEDDNGVPTKYLYGNVTLSPGQLVNIQAPNPSSWWRGIAPLKAAFNALDLDHFSAERQKYSMQNKIAPGMVISIESPMGISETQQQTFKADLTAAYAATESTGKPLVVGGATIIHDPPASADLQYIDTRRAARDEILAVLGLPPPVAGVLDNAILSNYRVAVEHWWNGYLFPILNSIYDALNAQLVQRVHGTNTRVWYDLTGSDVALQLLSRRAEIAQQLVTLGYPTNDAAREAGLEMPIHAALDVPNSAMVVSGRINPDGKPIMEGKQ